MGGGKDVLTCGQMHTVEIRLCRMQTLKDALVYHSFWTQKQKLRLTFSMYMQFLDRSKTTPFKHKLNISACQQQ